MMKQYMKYIGICLCAVLAVGLTACLDDEFDIAGGGDLTLKVTATTSFSGEEARAILDESQPVNISNYCLLVFDEKAADGNLIFAEDLTSSDLSNTTYTIPNSSQFAMLLGNVTLSQLGLSVGSSTVSALYSAMANVNAGDNNFSDASRFTWSACLDVSTTTTALAFNLKPNVAKVIVNVTNTSPTTGTTESVQLLNLQVRNVMNKVRYAQNALNDAGLFAKEQNKEGGPSVIDYNREAVSGTSASSVWYVPVNMCGTGNRTSNIPEEATYIEVTGVRGVDHLSTAYKIYLGVKTGNESYQNMTNFDVLPDKIYNVSLSITNDGLTFDVNTGVNKPDKPSSVANLVKLPSNANCHMINPNFSKTASGYPVYELPIDRIDECWGPSGQIPDASMRLGDSDEWTMDVIWQDINARVIQFCDKNGNNAGDSYSGKGYTPAYFKIYPGAVTSSHYGNILVGVKKKNSADYLWSWHLWVTDYNPDVATPYSVAKNTDVPGASEYPKTANCLYHEWNDGSANCINGNVQHWHHSHGYYWGNSTPGFKSKEAWEGLYANSWIMDRNLGAISDSPRSAQNKAYGLYYQWGSKNPYPHATYKINENNAVHENNLLKGLYKINGTDETFWTFDCSSTTRGTYKTVQDVTKKPNICYFVDQNEMYVSSYAGRDNYWASPVSITNRQKSIFDPCPPGWSVPMYNIIDLLTYNPSDANLGAGYYGGYSNTVLRPTYNTWQVSSYATTYNMKDFGMAVFMRANKTTGVNKMVYVVFPMQGVLSYSDNGISGNSKAMMWFAESSNITGKIGFGHSVAFFGGNAQSGSTYVNLTSTTTRAQTSKIVASNVTSGGVSYGTVWSGRVVHEMYKKSRGQNVRCIQTPDKETLKYYNK